MASFCPVNGSTFLGATGACVCSVGQYPLNGTCQDYFDVPTRTPEVASSEFVPPLPTAASWTNNNAQLISFEITCILVGVWCLFCLGLRFAPLENKWFRIRHKISRCDVIFSKQHWFDEQKVLIKRRTEMGGALSLGSLLFFVGLTAGLIWDLETQKQYTVESVVVASNREVQQFQNDLDFNLSGYGNLRCAMWAQPTVTTGMIAEEVRTVPASPARNVYTCSDTPYGIVLRFQCPDCTAGRENYVISSEFQDLNNTQAYAVGWNYSACAVHKSQHYRSCVTGSLAGGSNGTYAPAATLRGSLPNVFSFRFFPRIFRQFDPELLLLESQFRQYTVGSYAADNAGLRPLLDAAAGVRVALSLEIASSFMVITKSQSTNGVLTFLAKAGGLYTISYWLFYLVMMQFEKRIKRLRYDDKILNAKERQRIAQLRWDKLRLFVKYSRFGSRKRGAKPGQVILDVPDDADAPPGDSPRGTSGEGHFADKLKQTLSKLTDMRSDEEKIRHAAHRRDGFSDGGLYSSQPPHPPAPDVRNVQFQRSLVPFPTEPKSAGKLQRTASLPGGNERHQRNPALLPDFCLAQHIPKSEPAAEPVPRRTHRPDDYLLASQPSSLREEPGRIAGQPSRLRGGAPSPPGSPPADHVPEIFRFRGIPEAHKVAPSNGEHPFPTSPGVSPRDENAPLLDSNSGGVKSEISGARDGNIQSNGRGRDPESPVGDSPRGKRIHVSPPPARREHVSLPPRSLTPPLPTTPGGSRPPQSPAGLFADVGRGRRSRKRPKPVSVERNESEKSLAASEPGSSSTTPNSERGHHRRTSSGSGVALLANIQRGLSRVIPGSLPHLHIPGLGSADTPKPTDEEMHERLLRKKRKKLGYRGPAHQTGLVVRRLKRPSWLGHNCPLPAVPDAPHEDSDDTTGSDDAAPDVFAMYNHLQDLYDYNVRLREDFLLAQSMLENVVERFRPHSDL